MISFKNDYSDSGHPEVLNALVEQSLSSEPGYGEDVYTKTARTLVQKQIQDPEALVRFVSGGTQANLIVIASILKPFESVIAASSGHINRHEAGAIEATGHKVDSIEADGGKLHPELIQAVLNRFEDHHTVRPKLVYISNTTELGTVYAKEELQRLYEFCQENALYLFLDGARLGSALTSAEARLTLQDVAELTDVFSIGGTKNGALFGEAIVITRDELKEDFDFHIKQRGALMAKGRALGVQFSTLLQDGLYWKLAQWANEHAQILAHELQKLGFEFLYRPVSNQIFPILPLPLIEALQRDFAFYIWEKVGEDRAAIRLVTSWATQTSDVEMFISQVKKFQE